MYPFVESIKVLNNRFYNLEYHQQRFDFTRLTFYPEKKPILLNDVLKTPGNLLPETTYKCRVIYGEEISEVQFEVYTIRKISQYYLVVCPDEFDYSHKLTSRIFFDNARSKLKNHEDFIYIKKGLVTDSSFANLVFYDGTKYFTPAQPLLRGTKRAYYIQNNIIHEDEIRVRDLDKFKFFQSINAMVNLEESPAFSCDKLLLSHYQLKLC